MRNTSTAFVMSLYLPSLLVVYVLPVLYAITNKASSHFSPPLYDTKCITLFSLC